MGLDMRPMGKPKPGFEDRFREIYKMLSDRNDDMNDTSREELLQEWFEIQTPSYETIKAPRVGRDQAADDWLMDYYESLEEKPPLDEFLQQNEGYYVIHLAEDQDGVPVYIALGQDANFVRGEFLRGIEGLIGEDLVGEAWNTKLASETLDYGRRLMAATDEVAEKYDLQYLKNQREAPESEPEAIESQLHVVYSLANWLVFYGQNGHGYEADF